MLKPHIDVIKSEKSEWRGDIGKRYQEDQWQKFFDSYSTFINHYAEIAELLNVELFSISCELITASLQQKYWEAIIKGVREVNLCCNLDLQRENNYFCQLGLYRFRPRGSHAKVILEFGRYHRN